MKSSNSFSFKPLSVFDDGTDPALANRPWARTLLCYLGCQLFLLTGAAAGAVTMDLNLPSAAYPWSVVQGFILGACMLAGGLRVAVRRGQVYVLFVGWYLGALAALPAIWIAFFGNGWGWITWVALACALAAPSVLTVRRWPALGAIPALLLAAVPPLGFLGMGNPLLAAGAFFPGAGWAGIALMLAFFGLSAFRSRFAVLAQILLLGWAMANITRPAPKTPADAWAATTYAGAFTEGDVVGNFARQDRAQHDVRANVGQGAKLVILPESTDPSWDSGQAFYWAGTRAAATSSGAQVLVGVYTSALGASTRTDGIVDLANGKLYPARIAMPLAMWRPWTPGGGFPLHLGATDLIPTRDGLAAYLICYEELLVWPLASQETHKRPKLLLGLANQWFATGWLLQPQERSVAMQARLWGLPLLRAVNYQSLPFN